MKPFTRLAKQYPHHLIFKGQGAEPRDPQGAFISMNDGGALDMVSTAALIPDRTEVLTFAHVSVGLHLPWDVKTLDAMPPFLTGGSMITKVTMEEAGYLPAPQRFEAGTQPISQAVALAAAVNDLREPDMERIHEWEAALRQRLVSGLEAMESVRVLGPASGIP